MLYLGRMGDGYFWAIESRSGYYLYERSRATRWRTVYRGRVSARELYERFRFYVKPRIPERWYEVLRAAVGALLARLSPKERARFKREFSDLLEYFGFDDGG